MMRHARTATLVIAISLPASVVVAQPRTWTLWEVSEITEAKRVGSTFETTPTNYLALPMERDLDRGACELVKEGKIRNQHRMYESARPIPDGVMLTTPLGDKTQVITTKYLCLRAGEKPPEGRKGPTTIDVPTPEPPRAAPATPSRTKDADCRTIRAPDGSETVICGNR
jgi:hypothetical protein